MIVLLIFKQVSRCEGCFYLVEDLLEVNIDIHFISLHHAHVDALHLHLQFKATAIAVPAIKLTAPGLTLA